MKSSLTLYRKKRNFKETPEPSGKIKRLPSKAKTSTSRSTATSRTAAKSNTLTKIKKTTITPKSKSLFVIQLHDASHLHYDFRLKIGNVLKSWAVPKGPSLNPNDKRLAVETEDHPLDYAKFEGVIPEGHYGAGYVLIWDKGTFENCTLSRTEQSSSKRTPKNKNPIPLMDIKKAYQQGHIIFNLNGEKLQGKFVLQRFKGGEKPAWMLIKMKDDYANSKVNILKSKPKSVLSGLTLKQFIDRHA